jgi:hypothetical protein
MLKLVTLAGLMLLIVAEVTRLMPNGTAAGFPAVELECFATNLHRS